MATQQIGLEAIFDLSGAGFNKNIKLYVSETNKAVKETERAAGAFGKSWNQMGNTVAGVAKTMAVGIVTAGATAGAAITGFAVSGIKQAMDLEAQMSNIAATLNTTAEAIAPLKQLIMDLALDPNLSVSATEAAIAVENLSRNGLTMQEILDGAAHSTVLLANATGADFGTAADIATDTMAIFNVDAEDMATAIDGIVSVTNASKFTIDDYRLALAQAGAVAAGVGVSMEDFNTVIAGTASRFASGSDGGTSFKTTIMRLIPTTKEAHGVMTDLGLITTDWDKAAEALNLTLDGTQNTSNQVFEAFRDIQMTQSEGKITTDELNDAWTGFLGNFDDSAFFDATGNMEDMNEVSIALHKAFGDLTEEQRINALTTIAGADASRTMLGLIDLGAIAYTDAAVASKELGVSQEEVNKVIEGGITAFEALQITQRKTDAVQQAEERNRNFAAALKILQDTIGGVQLAIGDQFLPMLTEMARSLNNLIKENSPAIIAFFSSLRDWLATAIPQAVEGFKTVWGTLSVAFTTVKDAVVPVATALGNIASTLIDNLGPILSDINPNMDAFKGALTGIAAVLAAATISAGITAIAGALATLITPLGLVIFGAALLGAAWNTNFLGIRDTTLAVVGEIQTAFTPLTTAIQEFGSGALTEIQNFVTGNETEFTNLQAIWTGAQESFSNTFVLMQEAASGLLASLKEQFPQLAPVFDGFAVTVELLVSQVQAQWVLLQDATTAFVGIITSLISGDWAGAWQSAQDLAGAFVTYIQTTFANLAEIFSEPFAQIKALVTETFTGLTAEVAAQLPGWQAQLTEWGNAASQWIVDAIPIVQQKMTEWAAAAQGYVTENLPTWQSTLAEWGTSASQWIADASVIVAEKMTEWKTAVVDYVVKNLPTWQATLMEWGTAASQWIVDAVAVVTTQMATWGTAVLDYVTDNLPEWKTTLVSWGDAAWQWIVEAIPKVKAQITAWYAELRGFVESNLPNWIAILEEWTTAAWEWVVDAIPLVVQEMGKWYTSLSGALDEKLPIWQAAFADWITATWEWITEATPKAITEIRNWYTGLSGALAEKLPTFIAEMLKWATALVEWIGDNAADALPKLGEWLGKIIAWIPTGIVLLAAEMLKFSTVLVKWIGDNAADALPELGKWLGKILAWIPIGVVALGAGVVKLAGALISWIAGGGGGGGVTVSDSATGQVNAEFDKFLEALKGAIKNITGGFVEGVKAFVDSWKETISEHADWNQLGTDIMTRVKDGIESVKTAIQTTIQGIIDAIKKKFADAVQSFVNIGKDIVDGIIRGLGEMKQTLLDKVSELANAIPQWMRDLLGFGSPSKVMMEIGRGIIEGLLIGMRSQENRLYAAIQHISDGIARIAGRAGANAIAAYTSALSSFSSVGGSLLDRIGGLPSATSASQLIGDEQRTLTFLQEQADLIEAIRASGADPADVLRGVTLGPNADPMRLAQIVGFTMANLNHQLMISLQNAASGLDREIEDARARREDIAAIEERFQEQTFDARSNYARRLASIDEQIAQAESDAIRTGNRNVLLRIQSLDNQRNAIVKEFELLITHQRQLEDILARQPVSDNQRGQAAIERWRQTMIDPLVNSFEHLSAGLRAARLQEIDRNMRLIQGFAAQLPMIASAEARLMQALEGFGTGARNRAEQLLNLVYDPRMASVAASRAQAVHDFANSLNSLRSELARLSGQRLTGETIIERMMGGFDQMTAYQNALEAVDRQIAGMEAHIMETGNVNSLNAIRALDATRAQRQADIENFVRQTQALESIMRQVKNFSGPGQASAERFFQEQIQSIADAFSSPMRSVDRDAWVRTAQTRVEMINRFVEQMRQLERVQNRVAGNQNFAHLADEFAQLQDILMPETQRGSLINQLNSYITQMMRLHEIQRDISVGRGVNPLVERFASERLDSIARLLENINLSEAERNRLIEQYRIEQEKILAIQQKQQQLDFINQQLALINQLRSLDDEEDWSVNVESILSGIGLGMNASIDDLMRLTSRVLDELVRFANHELGIASPSKVFAKVGTNIMAGLESGILAGMRQPMSALRSAAGNLIPYSLAQRALTINMGGVTINDGIDAVMFEARIRQIVRSEFAA